MMCLVGMSYSQDTIITNVDNIVVSDIVYKNVPIVKEDGNTTWVKGYYYTNINNERRTIPLSDVIRISSKKLPSNENGDVVFKQVVNLKNSNLSKIYSKTKLWVADTWKSANDVIQNDDKSGGNILIKGLTYVYINSGMSMVGTMKYTLHYSVQLDMSDNISTITVKDIYLVYHPIPSQYNGYNSTPVTTYSETYNNNVILNDMNDSDIDKKCETLTKIECDNLKKLRKHSTNKTVNTQSKSAINEIETSIMSIVNSYGNSTKDLDSIPNSMSSDEALSELKRYKDKLDLGLISQEEFDKKKEELAKFIK